MMKNHTSIILQNLKILVVFILFTSPFLGSGQTFTTIAQDDANNYTDWDGTPSLNEGSGFQNWVFNKATPNSGFAGRYLGETAIGSSFGLYSGGDSDAFSSAERVFSNPLKPGDKFIVDIGHTNLIAGEVGLVLLDGINVILTLKFEGGGTTWLLNDGNDDFGIGQNFSEDTPLTLEFIFEGNNQYSYTFGSASGNNFNFSGTVTNIDGVRFFNQDQGGDQNFGLNNLKVERPTFTTIQNGDSNVAATWVNGDIPDGTGRININHELTVDAGEVLAATDLVLNSSGILTLNSTSTAYSSLIVDNVTGSGTIKYERFVNAIGNASSNGGNDLISAPVGTATFPDYLFQNLLNSGSPLNSGVIASSGFQFAFAPFNNSSGAYENYISTGTGNPAAPNSAQTIVAGKGYRVASTSGTNVTFIGPFLSTAVSIDISSPTNGSQWNLIGNPYPSYISSAEFLSTNTALLDATILDPSATAIYGYNSGTVSGPGIVGNFTIINGNTNSSLNIAPGQGFFVASNAEGGTVQFLPSMRTITGTDDFIQGRSASQNYKLILELDTATTFSTSFYFNANSSRGLDPGYDAAAFGENANNSPIYSHLVEDNTGRAMAMQSLSETDFTDIVIPLGVHSDQGTQLIFSIGETTLPSAIQVYLEDQVTHTTTLLNTSDYVLTPTTNLSGTGRFFLRFFDNALSDIDNTFDALNIYANNTTKTIVIAGQLLDATLAHIYDLQGRLVTKTRLKTNITNQSIDTSNLSTGVYVIQLESAALNKSQKIIIR
jgi:hypothetical protein